MAIRKCKRPTSTFNMSSMTDVVFLLLIFFMVTSTLVNPNALKLVLPKSTNQTANRPNVTVSIDENNVFYLNAKVTPFSQLERQIVDILKDTKACNKAYKSKGAVGGLKNQLGGSVFDHRVTSVCSVV